MSEVTTREYWMPDIPDAAIAEAYQQAAEKNILASLNPDVYFGYFNVCPDFWGHGTNTTFPGLDWGQSGEALLWLGRTDEVLASWDYVRSFQREDGMLPFAIIPDLAGKIGGPAEHPMPIDERGAVFRHWVPGDPFRTLANTTFIQMADAIFQHTRDENWLREQMPYLVLGAKHLTGMVEPNGLVGGAGYYLERPTRVEYDGVNQCYVMHAFKLLASLCGALEETALEEQYAATAMQIAECFRDKFWAGDHCVEYIHPTRGAISHHGLTDVDWIAVATGVLDEGQLAVLWPQLKESRDFLYSGIPTGISTRPETYEDWEVLPDDRHDLAAMGRVWYLEAWARSRMNDYEGLVESLHRVIAVGRDSDWYWRERYYSERTDLAPCAIAKYCEYPATLIRVVNRFMLKTDITASRNSQ